MADQLDPEQIAALAESLRQYKKAQDDATTEAERLKAAQERFGKQLGRSAADLGSSLYKGEKGVAQFGNAMESAATALQTLILAIPGIGLAMKALAVTVGVVGKAFNAASKQGDALYKTYQDLGRAGATASDGISGVFRNMQNLGYGIEELDKMVQLVTQNSETLAKFSMTAADGTNAFAQGMAQIQRDGQLRLLGKTTDDINSAGAAYIRQSVRAGMSQKDIGDKLGAQTKAYVLELDRLQRLTGMSADALQKQQDEAMAEDAYNDVMSELKQRAAAGDEVARMQIEKITTVMNKLGPEMRKEFIAGIGGDVSAQQRLFMAAPNLMKDTMDETANTQKTINNLNKDAANTVNTFGKTARLAAGAYRDTFGPLYEMRETMVSTADFDARTEAAKKNAQVIDKSTQNLTEAQIANMNSRDAMQAFIQKGVAPATTALAAMAKVASGAAGAAAGAVGAPTGGAAAGSKGFGTMDYKKEFGGAGAKGYLEKMIQAESGGRNIANQSGAGGAATSSAFGLAQITKGTFEGLAAKAGRDNPLYGKTFEDMKSDTKLQMEAAKQLTDQNRQFLESRKLPTTDAALYLAHFLGPGGAARALSQSDSSPLSSAVNPDQIEANPNLKKMTTVADLKNWADQKMGGSGYKFGGVASGPTSGYTATLHGTEAIVPLPDGKTIPVEMPGFGSRLEGQSSLMSQQLDKLDELVRIMQNQVSVSTKILQAAA
jgi:hypothetical protein